jgi:type II secretion system protein N
MPESRRPWKRRAAYAAFTAAAFVFALRQTFPADAVGERLVLEAAARGWQLSLADIAPAGLAGVRMSGVTLETREGARFPLDELTARLRPLPLLLGRRSVAFDARLYEGRVRGVAEERGGERRLEARVDGVDLGRAAAIRKLAGVDLAGTVSGDVDVALDLDEPAKSSGHLDLAVAQAAIQGGELAVAAMGGGALTLPRIGLGAVTAKAAIKDGRATFETLTATGADAELDAGGLYLQLGPRLAAAPLFGHARLRFQEALWEKGGAAGLRGIVELALQPGRTADGAYGVQLFGTVSRPQARPAPAPAAAPSPATAAPAPGATPPRPPARR